MNAKRAGIAQLPLHYGKAPRWLFDRMRRLAREIVRLIVEERGVDEILILLSNPFWFQCFGCVLGFDWHSSGVTTTVCGAIKDGIRGLEKEVGFFVCGGKGRTSRETPSEIESFCEFSGLDGNRLVYSSKMSAKVDSTCVQDGYQLYHHTFFFNRNGKWCVVQQGMNEENRMARRYHWLWHENLDFVCEPHTAVCCDRRGEVLNMVAKESEETRVASVSLLREKSSEFLIKELEKIETIKLPKRHLINASKDISRERLKKIFISTYENKVEKFEDLVAIQGVGAKTIRALALISEIIYGKEPSFRDPALFSFAHGGKDGTPYPIDRKNYDVSIEILEKAINQAKIGHRERLDAIKRLHTIVS